MKPITTSSYTFPTLIEGGYVYVDKTEQLLPLINEEAGQYFLSRPRRFGKSLLISTLEAIFSGRRELFKGLYIDGRDNGKDRYNWKKYPVIRIDMGSLQAESPQELKSKLIATCRRIAADSDVEFQILPDIPGPSDYFLELVRQLAAKAHEKKVVILVDEYDKPLLNHIGKKEAIPYRNILKSFYSVIKTTEKMQRFAFITGVSRFARVSIFSDLNNLTELTMDVRAATLLGYTREEVETNFADRLPLLAQSIGKTKEETLDRLARKYDGFRFYAKAVPEMTDVAVSDAVSSDTAKPNSVMHASLQPASVFNPVSVGKCFDTLEFNNYWFETATPTFLMDLLKKKPLIIKDLTAAESDFSVYEVESPDILPLLVQTGYLTIKDVFEKNGKKRFLLDYPNEEVRESFNDSLLKAFTNSGNAEQTNFIDNVIDALKAGDIEEIFKLIPPFFAQIPSKINLKNEKYYQTIFVAMFKMIGTAIEAEVDTNIGCVDAVAVTDKFVYVFEFKLDKSAKAAMKQIHEKKYYERYLNSGKKIMLVGAAFSQKTRNIGRHLVEVVAN